MLRDQEEIAELLKKPSKRLPNGPASPKMVVNGGSYKPGRGLLSTAGTAAVIGGTIGLSSALDKSTIS